MVDFLTGTAFDAQRRMNHREDEVALEGLSSVSPRARGLNALKVQNWRASGGGGDIPYPLASHVISTAQTVVNTGLPYNPSVSIDIEAEFMIPSATNSVLCGVNNSSYFAWCVPGSGCRFYSTNTIYQPSSKVVPKAGEFFRIRTYVGPNAATARVWADGEMVIDTSARTYTSYSSTIAIFAADTIGQWHVPAGSACRSFRAAVDGILVMDMVAVHDGDEGALWDKATKTLFRATGGKLGWA